MTDERLIDDRREATRQIRAAAQQMLTSLQAVQEYLSDTSDHDDMQKRLSTLIATVEHEIDRLDEIKDRRPSQGVQSTGSGRREGESECCPHEREARPTPSNLWEV